MISDNSTAICLTDEPDKVVYEFSWYETTYFDEIYHPRTAYEFMTHRYPYENTHPPLGKVIIACGMLIFGVNPFGWRFFGTLCGVLMVPLAYVMGKKMLKKYAEDRRIIVASRVSQIKKDKEALAQYEFSRLASDVVEKCRKISR